MKRLAWITLGISLESEIKYYFAANRIILYIMNKEKVKVHGETES